MTFSSGSRLGPYEILAPLGAGGMGEVHRARDLKLGREVAIKVLPEEFARDPERLARFEREARVLASLNHPRIAAIYSLEEFEGVRFLVLELVPGQTLAERLAAGPMPLEDALRVSRQIAEALEAAHEKGIIHRDLKPANVKLTSDGQVKVLDFGLAKIVGGESASMDVTSSPTIASIGTSAGVLLGTVAYMSPEQARTWQVDRRTDIWSFGCVLFETLTGRKAFEGESASDAIAAILRSDPDWTRLPAETPERIRTLLSRCLRKELDRRLRDAGDARLEIEDALTEPETPTRPLAPTATVARPLTRFLISLPADAPVALERQAALALSPSGRALVYVGRRETSTQLYLRLMDRFEAVPMPGTQGAAGPFFSSDEQWIGFFAEGKLKRIAIAGGAPLTICEVGEARGACWGSDDSIFFTPGPAESLWKVPAAGGSPSRVTRLDFQAGERTHRWPHLLCGGEILLFTIGAAGTESFDDALVAAQSLKTGERRVLLKGGSDGRGVRTGHLVYSRGGTLLAATWDPCRLALTGGVFPVLEGVTTEVTGAAHFAFSEAGSLAYVPGGAQRVRQSLFWVDPTGSEERLPLPSRQYEEPRLSPDGKRLALAIGGVTHDVWAYDTTRRTVSRLTFEGDNYAPVWTPDGRHITFSSNRDGPSNIFWKASDGSGVDERLLANDYEKVASSWSPDGRVLAYTEYHPETGADIWTLGLGPSEVPRPFLKTPFNEYAAMFSPDGRWLAYTSDESGRDEVYLMAFPGPGAKWQISAEGGVEPLWSRDGNALFYRQGDRLMTVAVQSDPFEAAPPRPLFERRCGRGLGLGFPGLPNYDVGPANRFVMVTEAEERKDPTQIAVTLEWFSELARGVSPGL